jgi:hypothetical protein
MAVEIKAPVSFEPNAFYERLIRMRATDRKTFESLSVPSKLALCEYEKQKREHAQEQEKR